MRTTCKIGAAAAFMVAFGISAHAASLSWNSTAPTVNGADIANFVGVSADVDNIAGGDDQGTYIAIGRDAVGQTFTTGGNLGGYQLDAVTLQHVNYDTFWSLDTGWNGYNGGSFGLQIGTISAGVFTPLLTEAALMDASAPANMNPGTGSAMFATISLGTPISLSANTTYGFAVYSTNDGTTDPNNGPYFEVNGDGTTSANYTGGEAFGLVTSSYSATDTVVSRAGDRVFHLDMVAVPEPASFSLIGLFGAGVLLVRRRFVV